MCVYVWVDAFMYFHTKPENSIYTKLKTRHWRNTERKVNDLKFKSYNTEKVK